MRSSTGSYYIGLDHVRALAALLVFCWHFLHTTSGSPVPFGYTPSFAPFSLFNEGHTGVTVFMVLSGYLFAKLLDGQDIDYPKFFLNRFLRRAPLMIFVVFICAMTKVAND